MNRLKAQATPSVQTHELCTVRGGRAGPVLVTHNSLHQRTTRGLAASEPGLGTRGNMSRRGTPPPGQLGDAQSDDEVGEGRAGAASDASVNFRVSSAVKFVLQTIFQNSDADSATLDMLESSTSPATRRVWGPIL